MRFFVSCFLLLCCGLLPLGAAQYFVDYASGSNANAGTTPITPWKHCPGDPAATGVPATRTLIAGDIVTFRGGVTYVFTAGSGIALKWDGLPGAPIIYDGNHSASWGNGRARFSDNYSGGGIAAFSSSVPRQNLVFRGMEISGIGGSASLPANNGVAVGPRYGAGIVFGAAITNVLIENCVFRELGYWFNQKPMSAASLDGVGVSAVQASNLQILNSRFGRVATAIQFSHATSLLNVSITGASFEDAVIWPVSLPVGATAAAAAGVTLSNSVTSPDASFSAGNWSGFGPEPSATSASVATGKSATFHATALGAPAPSYQWRKNGVAIVGASGATLHLASVSATDAGVYTALATNAAGSAVSNSAVLVVTTSTTASSSTELRVSPTFSTQPVSQTVNSGTTVVFSATAAGTPAPTYQWLRNGVAIPGATASSLSLANVSTASSGTYTVVAANTAGTATSTGATLTVRQPPVISTQPAGQTVNSGATVTFAVTASGVPAPTYQWRRNGVAISGATSASLVLSNVSLATAGTYSVVVANAAGSVTSANASLVVRQPPSMTTQPVSQTVNPGTTVTFNAAASGSPAPTYQWRKNGVAISGATGSSLVLSAVTATHSGTYTVVASNAAGSVVSSGAVLSVRQPPTITSQPASAVSNTGTTATFKVVATGVPAPTYQWRKNGVALTGATAATLSLPGVTLASAGTYSVVVTNTLGSVTSAGAVLTVRQPPAITAQPLGQTVNPGATVSFTVTATGVPAPTYQWRKNGVSISGATAASLTLSGVTASSAGAYTVVVTNAAGSVTSAQATLVVRQPPVFTVQPLPQSVTTGAKVTLTASATGIPAPTYQWRKNGAAISGATAASLTFAAVASSDAGTYSVVATNTLGSVVSNAVALTVQTPLASPPQAGSALVVQSTTLATNGVVEVPFTVSGTVPQRVLVRVSGPALATLGYSGAPDPSLQVQIGIVRLFSNDNWGGDPLITQAAVQLGLFPWTDAQSKDAAVLVSLAPGTYTARATNAAAAGLVLVEVHIVP